MVNNDSSKENMEILLHMNTLRVDMQKHCRCSIPQRCVFSKFSLMYITDSFSKPRSIFFCVSKHFVHISGCKYIYRYNKIRWSFTPKSLSFSRQLNQNTIYLKKRRSMHKCMRRSCWHQLWGLRKMEEKWNLDISAWQFRSLSRKRFYLFMLQLRSCSL